MIINCLQFVEHKKTMLKEKVNVLNKTFQIIPHIVIINTVDNPASASYIKNKVNLSKELGIQTTVIQFTESQYKLLKLIHSLNEDPSVHGIMVQLPLREDLSEETVLNSINPNKDPDCLTNINKAHFYLAKHYHPFDIMPATAKGVWELLKWVTKNQLTGKKVCLINRSELVGKPLLHLLNFENCTVTMCHSKTENVYQYSRIADITVSAVGIPHFLDINDIQSNSIVIDVGINKLNEKIVGDTNFEELKHFCQITPVPKGVGPITVYELFNNLVSLIETQLLKEHKLSDRIKTRHNTHHKHNTQHSHKRNVQHSHKSNQE